MQNLNKQPITKPPHFLIAKAGEFWGSEVKKATWEKVEFGHETYKHHGERSFVCLNNQACELVAINLFRHKSSGDEEVVYGIGKCLSCDLIYWGEVTPPEL